MGTWDRGILDNDCASDGIADLAGAVLEDIEALGQRKPSPPTTVRLGAAVGVLLQLSPYSFTEERGARVVAALQAHAGLIARFSPGFRRVARLVMAGEGEALAERPARLPTKVARALHADGARAFGRREPWLFRDRAVEGYMRTVTARCTAAIDEDFADESNWSDLCREGIGVGALAVLLVLEPCAVSERRLNGWRRKAQQGLATLIAEEDEELEFHREYYANLDRVFAALLRKFAA